MASSTGAATLPRIETPIPASADAPSSTANGPITDGQGRVYTPRVDPATGHLLLEHSSAQTGPQGEQATLAITIDIAPDQSFVRTVDQAIRSQNGDHQSERTVAAFSSQGVQLSEVTTASTRAAGKSSTEQTRGTFTNGALVNRVTDLVMTESGSGQGAERLESTSNIHAEWKNDGQPITDQTVPTIERRDHTVSTLPDGGINKGTDRVITFDRRATGTPGALTYPDPMKVVVRFNGRGSEYIERELAVPLDATGAAHYDRARVVRDEDKQSSLVKAATKARVWGGFAGSWMGIIGLRLQPRLPGAGKALMYAGVGASMAGVGGEAHALATRRNDASMARMVMELYDTTWLTLLVGLRTRGSVGSHINRMVPGALAAGGAVQGMELVSDLRGNGPLRTSSRSFESARIGASMSQIGVSTSGDTSWRPEPRFDAAAHILGAL